MALLVSPNLSVIVSIWMETLLYGMNVIVYFLCLYVFAKRRRGPHMTTTRGLLVVSTLLFLTASAHISVNFRRLLEGYVNPPTKTAMTIYLLDITQPTNIAKQFLAVIANLFSDILIIWRVYLVWGSLWSACILPILFSTGVFVTGIAATVYISLVVPGQSIFISKISSWGFAHFSLSLATNVTATFLIAGRIWWISKTASKTLYGGKNPYWRIVVFIIESASFAALGQTVELAFYAAKFPGVYFIADSVVQIISMAPLLIVVFVGLGSGERADAWASTHHENWESKVEFDGRHLGTEEISMSTVPSGSATLGRSKRVDSSVPDHEWVGHPLVLKIAAQTNSGSTDIVRAEKQTL